MIFISLDYLDQQGQQRPRPPPYSANGFRMEHSGYDFNNRGEPMLNGDDGIHRGGPPQPPYAIMPNHYLYPSPMMQQQQNVGNSHIGGRADSYPHTVGYSLSVSEVVDIPPELALFAAQPSFQQILLKVKEQSMINFISLNR